MDCTVSNYLERKYPTLFTILEIGHLDHSKWPEMCLPNRPLINKFSNRMDVQIVINNHFEITSLK